MTRLDNDALKQLLTRGWMTHDAMWFGSVLREYGMTAANRLNKAAIRSMAPIEVRRLKQALAIDSVDSVESLRTFFEGAFELLIGDFMEVRWSWQADGSVRIDNLRCFARDGMQRLGLLATYQCGIYERVFAWLDELGVDYQVTPEVDGCMALDGSPCALTLRFRFPA
jgi:hypothetical protein